MDLHRFQGVSRKSSLLNVDLKTLVDLLKKSWAKIFKLNFNLASYDLQVSNTQGISIK